MLFLIRIRKKTNNNCWWPIFNNWIDFTNNVSRPLKLTSPSQRQQHSDDKCGTPEDSKWTTSNNNQKYQQDPAHNRLRLPNYVHRIREAIFLWCEMHHKQTCTLWMLFNEFCVSIMLILNQSLLLCLILTVFVFIQSGGGWDLSGLEHRGYYYDNCAVKHVSIYYVRSFLCVKTNNSGSRCKC